MHGNYDSFVSALVCPCHVSSVAMIPFRYALAMCLWQDSRGQDHSCKSSISFIRRPRKPSAKLPNNPGSSGLQISTREELVRVLKSVFGRHGAVPMSSRVVGFCTTSMPANAAVMLDRSGALLALRHEMRAEFAAWLGHQVLFLRRFSNSFPFKLPAQGTEPTAAHVHLTWHPLTA